MKRLLLFLLFLFLGIGLFAWVVQRIGWEEIQYSLSLFSGPKGFSILLLTLFMLGAGAVRWRVILRSQGYAIPFSRLWQIYMGSFTIMFFTPMMFLGAELFRTYAARKLHDVPFSKAFASNIIDRLLEITAYIPVIFLGVWFFLWRTGSASPQLLSISLGILLLLAAAVVFLYSRSFRRKSILRLFVRRNQLQDMWELEHEVFRFFRWNSRAMWEGLFWSFLKSGIALSRAWLLLLFLGKYFGFFAALSILSFQYLALFVPIPASLGSHDAIQAFAFEAFGGGSSTGVAFAFLMRTVEAAAALLGIVLVAHVVLLLLRGKVMEVFGKFFRS